MNKPGWKPTKASERVRSTPTDKLNACDAREWIREEIGELFEPFWDYCHDGLTQAQYSAMLLEVLDIGGLMHLTRQHPSFASLNIPYNVRRFFYVNSANLRDCIEAALNNDGLPYFQWRSKNEARGHRVIRHHELSHALWRWFYEVVSPIAARFERFGHEDFSTSSFERSLSKAVQELQRIGKEAKNG